MRWQVGSQQRLGSREGADEAQKQQSGNRDSDNKARQQCTGNRGGTNGVTAPPQAADGAERGEGEGAVRGRRQGTAESLCSAAAPAAMVAADQLEQENLIGGMSSMSGGLTDSNHIAELKPAPQGVACPTDREFWGRL